MLKRPKRRSRTKSAGKGTRSPRPAKRAPRATGAQRPDGGRDRSSPARGVRELTWAELEARIQALAIKIRQSFNPDAVVGLAHGGVFAGGALARALSCEFFPVRISPRSRDTRTPGRAKSFGQLPPGLAGKRVLVVDDVASSGDLLELTKALALQADAKEARTACLVRREGGYLPDWVALPTEELVVFPWDYEPVAEDRRFEESKGPTRRG